MTTAKKILLWAAIVLALPLYMVGYGIVHHDSAGTLVVMGLIGALPVLVVFVAVRLGRKAPSLTGITLGEGEVFEQQFVANRIFGALTVGGMLSATSQRLIFVPHRLNVAPDAQKTALSILWTAVREAELGPSVTVAIASAVASGRGMQSEVLTVSHAAGADRFVVTPSPELRRCIERVKSNGHSAV